MGRKKLVTLGTIGTILALSGAISVGTYKIVQHQNNKIVENSAAAQLENELQSSTQFENLSISYVPTVVGQKLSDITLNEADVNNFRLFTVHSNGVKSEFTNAHPGFKVSFAFKQSEFYVSLGKARLIITITNEINPSSNKSQLQPVAKTFEWPELFSGFKVETPVTTDLDAFANSLVADPATTVIYNSDDAANFLPSQVMSQKFLFGFKTKNNGFEEFTTVYGDQSGEIMPIFAIDQAKSNDKTGTLVGTVKLRVKTTGYETVPKEFTFEGFKTQASADQDELEQLINTIDHLDYTQNKSKTLVANAKSDLNNFELYAVTSEPWVYPESITVTKTVAEETAVPDGSVAIKVTLSKNGVNAEKIFIINGFRTVLTVEEEALAAELAKFDASKVRVPDSLQAQFASQVPSKFNLNGLDSSLIFTINNTEQSVTQYNYNDNFALHVDLTASQPNDTTGELRGSFYLTNIASGELKSEAKTFVLTGFKTALRAQKEAIVAQTAALDHIEFPLPKNYLNFNALSKNELKELVLNNIKMFDANNNLLARDADLHYELIDFSANPYDTQATFKLKVSYQNFSAQSEPLTIPNLEPYKDYIISQAQKTLAYYQWVPQDNSQPQTHLPSQIIASSTFKSWFAPYQTNGQLVEGISKEISLTLTNFSANDDTGQVDFDVEIKYQGPGEGGEATTFSQLKHFQVSGFAQTNTYYAGLLQSELAKIETSAVNNYDMSATAAAALISNPNQVHNFLTLYQDAAKTTVFEPKTNFELSFEVVTTNDLTGQVQFFVVLSKGNYSAKKLMTLTGLTPLTQTQVQQKLDAELAKISTQARYQGKMPATATRKEFINFSTDVGLVNNQFNTQYQVPAGLELVLVNTSYEQIDNLPVIFFTIQLVDRQANLSSAAKRIRLDEQFGTDETIFNYYSNLNLEGKLDLTSAVELNKLGKLSFLRHIIYYLN
ncbi:lipoprotein 17-related variable surface protein [Mycoplasmopsis columbinasalis]|uniref:Lipoprotein associated domain n=1 Tax=Mycoplasmopsis columbinasalis TaxID=114880 RepID=A0A449BB44_9BACT|nr:lipoprotein 17-related variable surface protein [Mycoplasmopsis columbinasalis]VEU78418.1 Lipoprotein associated domain [Mycoplasmopsis columbinasalis]